MSKLSAFLHPVQPEIKEVIISDRFVERDEKGNPVLDENGETIPAPFKIRPITQEENDALVKRAKRTRTVNGMAQEYVDSAILSRSIVLAATVEPNFSDKELCDAYGVMDPSMVPGKMLLSGEYAKLTEAISDLSGFNYPAEEEAKN